MATTTLKFGKFKGQDFYSTPKYYQDWLLKQDWFKLPVERKDDLLEVQKEMSKTANSLRNWNGYSKRGEAQYSRMFELEQMESDIMYCNCGNLNEQGKRNCGMDCGW